METVHICKIKQLSELRMTHRVNYHFLTPPLPTPPTLSPPKPPSPLFLFPLQDSSSSYG